LAVKISAPAPCIFSPRKYFCSGPSPIGSFWSAMYLTRGETIISDPTHTTPQKLHSPIRAKRSRQHRDIPKNALERFIKDITHLILEILRRHEGVEQIDAEFPLERDNLATRPAHVTVNVETLPEVVDGGRAGHGADVEEDADVGFQDRSERVEEPPVRVDLLLVLLFQAEDDLDRRRFFLRTDFGGGRYGDCGGVGVEKEIEKKREGGRAGLEGVFLSGCRSGRAYSGWYTRRYAP
jgi:hypothetical protein